MPGKIMIVDDELDTLESFKTVLENEGFDIVMASSGQECLDKLRKEKVDLILIDFFMPEMSGRRTVERIREDPGLTDAKVAFLTVAGFGDKGKSILEELNVVDYLRKSITMDEFIVRINKMLE